MMNRLAALAFTLALAAAAHAAEWLTDFQKAKELAAAQDKAILLDFTGSDWCAGCIQLKKQVFSTPEFAAWAKENAVLVKVDFPMKKKLPPDRQAANEKLEKQFNIEGYPTVVLTSPAGKKLGQEEGYLGEDAQTYITKLDMILKSAQ